MTMHLIKSRHVEVKRTNIIRAHPMVSIDINLIGYKTPKGMDAENCAELIATIFSSNSVEVLV